MKLPEDLYVPKCKCFVGEIQSAKLAKLTSESSLTQKISNSTPNIYNSFSPTQHISPQNVPNVIPAQTLPQLGYCWLP